MWYVYFLRLANGDIYVGSTNDLRRRVEEHRSGRVRSTHKLLPATLQCYVAVRSEARARALETYFKSGSGEAVATKRLINAPLAADPTGRFPA